MTHGGAAPTARTAADAGLERTLGGGVPRQQVRLVVAIAVLAAAVFAVAFLIARAGRPEAAPAPRTEPAAVRLAAPRTVQVERVTAVIPALGAATKVPDLERTPRATPEPETTTPQVDTTTPPAVDTTTPPAVDTTPQVDTTTPPPVDTTPPADTGGGGSNDGGDVICSPC
jgi:hypothetical protein